MIHGLGIRRPTTTGLRILAAVLLCVVPPPSLQAAEGDLDAPFEVVEFTEADTLRGIVGRYLRDPDLWPTVLRLNEIGSPADLVPGIQLRLPVGQVLAADEALVASLTAIQMATAEGARIFAPVEIGDAINHRDTAVSHREGGEWRAAVDFSGIATKRANEALDISVKQRDRAAEADNGVEIEYHAFKEGALMWFDQMAIPVDAPNPEAAHVFLNFIMDAQNMADASNYVYYANGNLASQPLLEEDVIGDTAIYPDAETLENLYTVTPYEPKVQRVVTRLWTKIKSGV